MSSQESQDENEDVQGERDDQDVLTILVATDIHLGYGEKDLLIAEDSFDTFEEILRHAKEENADFLLLGGDLFHDTRPSSYALNKCIELLKRYCLGDRPIQIEFLSDPAFNFSSTVNDTVNYEDPNLNVELPVFSIHGNHDDPTGVQQISALNILSSTGLVNYFGRYNSYESIDIEPILLKKGRTKLALYGLSHIKDEKLARLFTAHRVSFMTPSDTDSWFHLLVLHQNRANRGAKCFIPDEALPSVLDLVIWGHEHDCRINPEQTGNDVFITQPGSSVATSLCVGESLEKHIGLLKIHKNQFNLRAIPLKTVRPFIFSELVFTEEDKVENPRELSDHQELARKVVGKKVEEMLEKALSLGREGNKLPLIRLNVSYIDETQAFNPIRFGEAYVGRVANPGDMVKVKHLSARQAFRRNKNKSNDEDFEEVAEEEIPARVEDLVLEYFESGQTRPLEFMPLKALNETVSKCIESDNMDYIESVINHFIADRQAKLEAGNVSIDKMDEFLESLRVNEENDAQMIRDVLNRTKSPRKRTKNNSNDSEDSDEESTDMSIRTVDSPPPDQERPKTGPGSRGGRVPARGRGSRGGRGSRARGKANA
ncbi:double-strand break repair protein MRE11 [Sitophilus oryzae]|uniref:Double-strand break repair protein n=1 Tax=Sitophilus oryzae TaxID=7048 RepID=A0A6J2YMF0_SITOR|nr:double-strand break repair protein MRE11 [Sitophilus oryzae]